jgi:nitrite reductase/ring-hydroxylating ferredoxin subunit
MEQVTLVGTSQQLVLPLFVLVSAIVVYSVVLCLPTWADRVTKRINACLHKATTPAKEAALEESLPVVSQSLDFPDDWWTSPKLFQLEKRAILSKTWLHVCHASIFKKPGDFRTFTIADFSFLVILGKDGQLCAFHNVCRHRAYTVCTKPEGNRTVFMCRYHGWSYDTKGKLVKAPKFDDVQGFDKSANSLFEIRTFIDSSGFVYANFDVYGSDGLTIRVGVPIRAKLSLVESWTVSADFNWKVAVAPGAFRVCSLTHLNKLAELLNDVSGLLESWRWPAEFELSPLTRLMRSSNGEQWLTVSVVPVSETKSSIQCSFFTSRLDPKATLPVSAAKQEIINSVKKLEMAYADVSFSGNIPDSSSQEPLLAEIKAHTRLERLMGQEVYPASRMRETSSACKVADDLCRELEMAAGEKAQHGPDILAW